MKSIVIFTVLLSITTSCYCQEVDSATHVVLNDTALTLKKKIYVININKGGLNPSFGYLQSINRTTLSLTTFPLEYGTSKDGRILSYNNIDKIRIHRKGSVRRGAIIGSVVGIVLGGLIGGMTYSKPTPIPSSESGLFGGFTFDFGVGLDIIAGSISGLLLGLPIGALSGSYVKGYHIDKNKEAFEYMGNNLSNVYGIKKDATKQIDQ